MSLVTDYLDASGVPYEVLHQDPPTVALEEAQGIHRRRGSLLKAMVIDTRGRHAVAVIPASRRLDMRLVRKALADPSVHLASEDELQSDSPRSNWVGPVLGWLLDAETLVDPSVLECDTVVFAAGTRTESVRVRTRDLFRGEHAAFVPLAAELEPARMDG